eukprot:Skav228946  [mRNA]  locus=scaffold2723:27601:31967:+ [translate_table: standard]
MRLKNPWFQEPAIFVSAVDTPRSQNAELYKALLAELHARRLTADFTPNAHLGALVALRDLGVAGCKEFLRQKCHGDAEQLPSTRLARQEGSPVPPGSFPATHGGPRPFTAQLRCSAAHGAPMLAGGRYAKLRMAIQLNGFRCTAGLRR